MPKTTVTIDGKKQGAQPGFHVFVRGNPPRLVCYVRGMRCERCRGPSLIWMTDDWRWRRLPRRYWKSRFCVSCFRELAPQMIQKPSPPPARRRRFRHAPIWRARRRVNWQLYSSHPQRLRAEAALDRAFAAAAARLRADLAAGRPKVAALSRAFHEGMGPTMHQWGHVGAVDTEPCANVRLAFAELAGRYSAS